MRFTEENFSKILIKELKKRKMTRSEFAVMVGVAPKTIENWLYQKTPLGMIGVLNFFNKNK